MFSPNDAAFSFLDKAYRNLKQALPDATEIKINFGHQEREGTSEIVPMWTVQVHVPANDKSGDLLCLDASGEGHLDEVTFDIIENVKLYREENSDAS